MQNRFYEICKKNRISMANRLTFKTHDVVVDGKMQEVKVISGVLHDTALGILLFILIDDT